MEPNSDSPAKHVVARSSNGQWVKGSSGNPRGNRPNPEVQELRDALLKIKSEKDESFLEMFVRKSYDNPAMAIALAAKILPDLQKITQEGMIEVVVMPTIKINGKEKHYDIE